MADGTSSRLTHNSKSVTSQRLKTMDVRNSSHCTHVPQITITKKQMNKNKNKVIAPKKSADEVGNHVQNVYTDLFEGELKIKEEVIYIDPSEKESANTEMSMRDPLSSSDPTTYSCDECQENFIEERLLNAHKTTDHQTSNYKYTIPIQNHPDINFVVDPSKEPKDDLLHSCSMCKYKCKKMSTLEVHVAKKHNRTDMGRLFKCSACDLTFEYKCILKSHFLRKHTNIYKFTCDLCGKKYKVKGDLTNHIRFYHNETAIVCEICGKACSNSNSLYTHQKRFHYKPEFECQVCKRRMVTQENLNQHVLTQHEKKERVICEECGKSFSNKVVLNRHMESVHNGIKSHACSVCNKSFSRVSHLRQHLLIHTGTRSFVCDICGKGFAQKPGLISHRKIHPGSHPPLPVMRLDNILNEFIKK